MPYLKTMSIFNMISLFYDYFMYHSSTKITLYITSFSKKITDDTMKFYNY